MMESGYDNTPIYAIAEEEEHFALVSLNIVEERYKANWTRRSLCSILDLHDNWKTAQEFDGGSDECAFYLSCLIFSIAMGPQKKRLARIADPKTVNIKLVTEASAEYLKKALKQIKKINGSKNNTMTEKSPKMKELEVAIDESLAAVRRKLGFPEQHFREICYKITPEVIASATEEKCRTYLEQQSKSRYIFSDRFEEICKTLNADHSTDAGQVVAELKATKSRDHLSIFSISTENDQIYISIVNEEGKHIKMESWNFIRLIENPNITKRLHEFVYKRGSSYIDFFTYNNNKEGCVVGQMDTNRSYLNTACLSMQNETMQDRAVFLLDTTYTLCMYITLKRLAKDKDRFNILFYQSITFKPIKDPFEHAPDPFV